MNAGAGGSISASSSSISNQQLPQQQQPQQVTNSPQIGRSFIPANPAAATLEIAPSTRGGSVLPVGNGSGQIQTFNFDPVIEQELQRQMDDFKKTVTIVLWFKARTEPLRIQHTIRSFPFFQMSTLASVVHDLGLADESYIDAYIPDSDQWMQHTIRTVRIVDSQQRLLYKIRKSLLEGINAEDCTGLPAELELQKQMLSRKRSMIKMEGGLPTPLTPALNTVVKDTGNKNPRKRPAIENGTFDHGNSQPQKVHIQNSYYLTPQNDGILPQVLTSTSVPIVSPTATTIDESPATASGSVGTVSHTVPSSNTDYLYQGTIYYTHPPTTTNDTTVTQTQPTPDTPHLVQSEGNPTTIAYRPDQPIKRWPNDYSVADISTGFHEMDRLVTQTPNLTQRVAFERVFGTRYVKSTVCRHRGVWKRASRAMRDHFITMGNDERASWTDFVRAVEGRPTLKVGGRHQPTLSASSHETIEFPVVEPEPSIVGLNAASNSMQGQSVSGHAHAHDDSSGGVEEPPMDSLQSAAASGSSSGGSALQNELNVFDAALSHIPSSQA